MVGAYDVINLTSQEPVRVIKNSHTDQELAESGERWASHEGPYLTLEEVLAIEAAKEKSGERSI